MKHHGTRIKIPALVAQRAVPIMATFKHLPHVSQKQKLKFREVRYIYKEHIIEEKE